MIILVSIDWSQTHRQRDTYEEKIVQRPTACQSSQRHIGFSADHGTRCTQVVLAIREATGVKSEQGELPILLRHRPLLSNRQHSPASKGVLQAYQRISSTSSRLRQEDDIRLARACVRHIEVVVCIDKVLSTRHTVVHVMCRHVCTTRRYEIQSEGIES